MSRTWRLPSVQYGANGDGEKLPLLPKIVEEEPLSKRKVFIGPLLGIYMLSCTMSYHAVIKYTNDTWMERKIGENATNMTAMSECATDGGNPIHKARTEAREESALYIMYYSIAGSLPAFAANIVLGSFSDALGRKFLLGVGIIGTGLRMVASSLIVYYDLDIHYFLGALVLEGCTGQHMTVIASGLAYISDITNTTNGRSYGIAYIYFMLGATPSLARSLSDFVIENYGYMYIFIISGVLLLLSFLLLLLLLPESYPKHLRKEKGRFGKMLHNCVSFLKQNDGRSANNHWKYQILFAAHALCCFGYTFRDKAALETLYSGASPFCWNAREDASYDILRSVAMLVVTVMPVHVCKLVISEIPMAMLGVASIATSFYVEGFASSTHMLYAAACVGCLCLLEPIMVKTIVSCLTDASRQGALFSAIGAVETIAGMLSEIAAAGIYSVTMEIMKGLVFIIMGGFNIIALILLAILYIRWKQQDTEITIIAIQNNDNSDIEE